MTRNALLVYPEFPTSYWSMRYALEFVGKKSSMPPLGLLTVAAMFPDHYDLRVVDMNVQELTDADLEWADVAFLSAMLIQKRSFDEVVARCREKRIATVAGGPFPTTYFEDFEGVDHILRGEVEEIFPGFLEDLDNGTAQPVYTVNEKPSVVQTPVPRYDLIPIHLYESMAIQFSRGCPFDCEFCDITKLFGRVPRTKTNEQIVAEMQNLYDLGWRGSVFLVDDNFIGNKRDAMRLMPAIGEWQEERDYPFALYTEASVNLAEMDELLDAMVDAGFFMVFLGIETPNPEVLTLAKKGQNVKKGQDDYLLRTVRKIQNKGMQVTAGFILGMDGETDNAFDAQIDFIQEAGIPKAMVGMLTAIRGTDLYKRLEAEGRLLEDSSGNNVEATLNFVPQMDRQKLAEGYLRVLSTLYDPTLKNYFERCWTEIQQIHPKRSSMPSLGKNEILAFLRSMRRQMLSRQGPAYLKFLIRVLTQRPRMFPEAVSQAICGYHFEKITVHQVDAHSFLTYLQKELHAFRETWSRVTTRRGAQLDELRADVAHRLDRAHARYRLVHFGARETVRDAFDAFQLALEAHIEKVGA